jgi:Cdc6-like AAA superfamily ATPase
VAATSSLLACNGAPFLSKVESRLANFDRFCAARESNYASTGAPTRKDFRIVIVTGGSGSGKTTMLEELLRELLKLDATSSYAPLFGERIGKGVSVIAGDCVAMMAVQMLTLSLS